MRLRPGPLQPSPDSIRQSIDWVRTHNSQSFSKLHFQYGRAIADLGHVVVCFEGMSRLAATGSKTRTWDDQASPALPFFRSGFVT